jgi:hypothetical protein
MYGTSFYATYKAKKNVKLFARYDDLNSKKLDGESEPWQIVKDGQLMLAGVEYSPVKGIKITPNVRFWNPDMTGSENETYLYLSAELKF